MGQRQTGLGELVAGTCLLLAVGACDERYNCQDLANCPLPEAGKEQLSDGSAISGNESIAPVRSSDALESFSGDAASIGARRDGATCEVPSDCASGFCVSGFCCDVACDELCAACDVPGNEGTCSPAPEDAACTTECPESTECLTYVESSACKAVGRCDVACKELMLETGTPCRAGGGVC